MKPDLNNIGERESLEPPIESKEYDLEDNIHSDEKEKNLELDSKETSIYEKYASGGTSGITIGNGGDGFICRNNNGELSVVPYDYFEASSRWDKHLDFGSSKLSIIERVQLVIDRLKNIDDFRYKLYSQYAQSFFDNTNFWEDLILPGKTDADPLIRPSNCIEVRIARQQEPETSDDKYYNFNKELYELMSDEAKISLILHEIIFRDFRSEGHSTSTKARYFNTLMGSGEISKYDSIEYSKLTQELNISYYRSEIAFKLIDKQFENEHCSYYTEQRELIGVPRFNQTLSLSAFNPVDGKYYENRISKMFKGLQLVEDQKVCLSSNSSSLELKAKNLKSERYDLVSGTMVSDYSDAYSLGFNNFGVLEKLNVGASIENPIFISLNLLNEKNINQQKPFFASRELSINFGYDLRPRAIHFKDDVSAEKAVNIPSIYSNTERNVIYNPIDYGIDFRIHAQKGTNVYYSAYSKEGPRIIFINNPIEDYIIDAKNGQKLKISSPGTIFLSEKGDKHSLINNLNPYDASQYQQALLNQFVSTKQSLEEKNAKSTHFVASIPPVSLNFEQVTSVSRHLELHLAEDGGNDLKYIFFNEINPVSSFSYNQLDYNLQDYVISRSFIRFNFPDGSFDIIDYNRAPTPKNGYFEIENSMEKFSRNNINIVFEKDIFNEDIKINSVVVWYNEEALENNIEYKLHQSNNFKNLTLMHAKSATNAKEDIEKDIEIEWQHYIAKKFGSLTTLIDFEFKGKLGFIRKSVNNTGEDIYFSLQEVLDKL